MLDALAETLELRLKCDVLVAERPVLRGAVQEVRVVDGGYGQDDDDDGAANEQLGRPPAVLEGLKALDERYVKLGLVAGNAMFLAATDGPPSSSTIPS